MPPTDFRLPCPSVDVTTESFNTTGIDDKVSKDDLNALLYIVVTLLFYSLGIVVGIITYLKREKEEIEEDKCFDEFLQMKRDPFNYHKMEKVNLVAARLKEMEKNKLAREELIKKELHDDTIAEEEDNESNNQNDVNEINSISAIAVSSESHTRVSRPNSLDTVDIVDDEDKQRKHALKPQHCIFQVTPTGEPIASVVAKIFDSERRGGLKMSPPALHHIDRKKQRSTDSETHTSLSSSDIRVSDSNSYPGKSDCQTNCSVGKGEHKTSSSLGKGGETNSSVGRGEGEKRSSVGKGEGEKRSSVGKSEGETSNSVGKNQKSIQRRCIVTNV